MIKVGEYVRTKDKILKVDSFEKDNRNIECVCFTTGEIYTLELLNKIIVNHSKNIIDLIEVGDIVHIKDVLYQDIVHIWSEDYLKALKEDLNNGIKVVEILTHEQFEQNCYTVERK